MPMSGPPRSADGSRRVVITGIGVISSLGNDYRTVAESLDQGRSGLISFPQWQELGLRSWVGGHVDDTDARERSRFSRRSLTTMGEVASLCVLAGEHAIDSANLDAEHLSRSDFGCIAGSGVGSMAAIHQGALLIEAGKSRRVRPHSILQAMSSAPSAHLVQSFGIGGRSYAISSACATSANALGHAFELIREGRLTGALAGGGEHVSVLLAGAFGALRNALSSAFNDQPQKSSRPFDAARDGFVLSGGAGIVVLEERGSALERGARVLGEVLGYASNSEAYDPILPEPEGVAAAACMNAAIADAGLEPSMIDYVNAHATGTPAGDLAEVRALRRVFGGCIPSFSSTKGLAGHAIGAAGVHEVIHSLAMIDGGFLAPTANLERLDPEVADAPALMERENRRTKVHLSNSFGFGGTNATLVLGGAEESPRSTQSVLK